MALDERPQAEASREGVRCLGYGKALTAPGLTSFTVALAKSLLASTPLFSLGSAKDQSHSNLAWPSPMEIVHSPRTDGIAVLSPVSMWLTRQGIPRRDQEQRE